jgi:hypothetical protein
MPGATTKVALTFASIALVLCLTAPARAFEREWHVGLGFGMAAPSSGYDAGPAVGVHGAYGLSDEFDARLEILASGHGYKVAGVENNLGFLSAAALLSYKIDIISWIPYLGAGLGYYHATRPPPPGNAFRRDDVALAFELGLDYAAWRHVSLGIGSRFDLPFNDFGGARYFAVLLRGEYRWGW